MMVDEGYEKVCRIKSLLAECMVPPREAQFLNLDRYVEDESKVTFIPDPPHWCNISFRGFQERVLTYRPQHWGADPNAVLWFSKYGWRCVEKFVIKCDICSSTVDCSCLIQKPDLWGELAHKAHDDFCYWSFCPCPDRFIQIVTHPKILCKNVHLNWKKIITFGAALPRIQQTLLDKMGLTSNVLEHIFKVMESDFSEEGVAALVLVICGWLKNSEDKILECAYCQRHLALGHFLSIADDLEINESSHIPEVCSGNEIKEMEESARVDESFHSETTICTTLDEPAGKTEFIHTPQRRKQARKCHPAIHNSTAYHRAHTLACVTKQKFPSYCNILHLRYGITLTKNKRASRKKKVSRKKHSDGDGSIGDKLMSNEDDFSDKKFTQELSKVEMKTGDENSSISKDENIPKSETVSAEQKKGYIRDSEIKPDRLTMDSEIPLNIKEGITPECVCESDNKALSSTAKENTATVNNMVCSVEEIAHLESEQSSVDSEMIERNKSPHDNTLKRKATEGSLGTDDQYSTVTQQHSAEECGEKSSMIHGNVSESSSLPFSDRMQTKCTELDDVSDSDKRLVGDSNSTEQENEVKSIGTSKPPTISANGELDVDIRVTDSSINVGQNLGKRQLTCDNNQQADVASKRIKTGPEDHHLKKKDLNPVNEHRFWCIWKIKTIDRLLGSPKEGWKQILDLLKFGVSSQNSEVEEEESTDVFEDVKKIHYMMSGW